MGFKDVFESNAVKAIIALIVIAFIAVFFVIPALSEQKAKVLISVVDDEGKALRLQEVKVWVNGIAVSPTLKTNVQGKLEIIEVKVGSSLKVEVDKTAAGFNLYSKTVVVDKSPFEFKVKLSRAEIAMVERTVIVESPDGSTITNKKVTLNFTCTNRTVIPKPSSVSRNTGVFENIVIPENCGVLIAQALVDGFQASNSNSITEETTTIRLQAVPEETGSILVKVFNTASSERLYGVRLNISLLNANTLEVVQSKATSNGEALFNDVPVGAFLASVTNAETFAMSDSEATGVTKGKTSTLSVFLSREKKASLKLKVLNAETSEKVENASVSLLDANGNVAAGPLQTASGDLEIALFETGTFTLMITHDDFLNFEKQVQIADGENSQEARLEKCNARAGNCGMLKVTVVDEDEKKVENARVLIYNSETGFLASLNAEITDANGVAWFKNLEKASYFLKAFKFPAESKGSAFAIDPQVEKQVTFVLTVGQGIVRVNVRDEDGTAVNAARVEFRTLSGLECAVGECVTETDSKGIAEHSFKADKSIFVIASKQGFIDFVSSAEQVFPNEVLSFNVLLEKEILGNKPIIEASFFEERSLQKVEVLKAGKTYTALLKLKVPQALQAKNAGIHVRVGKESLLENDFIMLKQIGAPEASVLKGTSFHPFVGWQQDSENLTNADAKWASIVWNNARTAVYNASVNFKVKRETPSEELIPFYYRAWVETSSGEIIRSPEDVVLGTSLETSSRQELYAEVNEKPFREGITELCKQEYCFFGERVLDEREGLNLQEPFVLRVFSPFTFWFKINNNSGKSPENAVLRIKSTDNGIDSDETLLVKSYSITVPGNPEKSNSSLNDFELPDIMIENFRQNSTLEAVLSIEPRQVRSSSILVQLIVENDIVFEQAVDFYVKAKDELHLQVSPEFIGAFVETELNITVKDDAGVEVEDALVRVKKTSPEKNTAVLGESFTDRLGKAIVRIPLSSPESIIKIEAEKDNYAPASKELKVDSNILEFSPEILISRLNLVSKHFEDLFVEAKNLISLPLTVSDIEVQGSFQAVLDEDSMNAFLHEYINQLVFEQGIARDFTVKTRLNPALVLKEPKQVEGRVLLSVENKELTKTWSFKIPLKVQVGLASAVDNSNCLAVSLKEWKTATEGGIAREEFAIRNNCSVSGKKITLNSMTARLDWSSNVIGNVSLSVSNPETGMQAVETLRDGETVTIMEEVMPSSETEYYAVLSFVPGNNVLGQTAMLFVTLDGTITTASGEASVGSSNSISASILVMNLEQCIEFSPSPEAGLVIGESEDSGILEVSTQECGPLAVDFRFCQDSASNANCKGGTSEGGIMLSSFSINNLREDSKEIIVERQSVPGAYGLTVEARVPGKSWRKIIDYPVIIEPEDYHYFSLDKYKFSIIGEGSKDSTDLYNKMLEETVEVEASICTWFETIAKQEYHKGNNLGQVGSGLTQIGTMVTMIAAMGRGGAGAAATAAPATMLPTASAIGIGIAVIGVIVSMFASSGYSSTDYEEVCREIFKAPFKDFVINLKGGQYSGHYLPADAQDLIIDRSDISAEWNLETSNNYKHGENAMQEVGIVFENAGVDSNSGLEFAVLTVPATEHLHGGNSSHDGSAKVFCNEGGFDNYNVPCDESTQTYRQKFHLMFESKKVEETIPKVSFDTVSCTQGSLLGRTGVGAIPRVSFNWSWLEQGGVTIDYCDASNPNAYYCDATQFTIMALKRINELHKFLQANDYFRNVCPSTGFSEALNAVNSDSNSREVAANSVGISEVSSVFKGSKTVELKAKVKNNTLNAVSADLTVEVRSIENNAVESCSFTGISIPAGQEVEKTCEKTLNLGGYYTNYRLESDANIDSYNPILPVFISEENKNLEGYNCNTLRTTDNLLGEPLINLFINEAERQGKTIQWPSLVKSKAELAELLHFSAFLVKDNFSSDFKKDFAAYYDSEGGKELGVLAWFNEGEDALKKLLLDEEKFKFTQKYFETSQLPSAGRFKVDIGLYFGEDWHLFKNGEVSAGGGIQFYLIQEPSPDSPFYYLPFNGRIGTVGTSYNRQGYGTQFENLNEVLKIDESPVNAKTFPDDGSNAQVKVVTSVEENLKALNVELGKRGNVLSVEKNGAGYRLDLTGSFATPVILKTSQKQTPESFSVFYTLLQDNVPASTGESLAYWTGAGNCKDFSGIPAIQAFNEKPDRKARQDDGIQQWQSSFAVDWENSAVEGSVFLRSIFYTPRSSSNALRIVSPVESAVLFTPDSSGSSVELNGVSTMQHNRQGLTQEDSIDSIEDVFELVKEEAVCVSNTGVKARFWWNPKTIIEQAGMQRSTQAMTESLNSGNQCA